MRHVKRFQSQLLFRKSYKPGRLISIRIKPVKMGRRYRPKPPE